MKSITIKGVILVHNEGTFFIEAKVIDDFVNLQKKSSFFIPRLF